MRKKLSARTAFLLLLAFGVILSLHLVSKSLPVGAFDRTGSSLYEERKTFKTGRFPDSTRSHAPPEIVKKIPSVTRHISKVTSFPVNAPTPRRYKNDVPALKRYLHYLSESEELLPEQKRAVIILTNHRSGSSFFGELFNQHPDSFYIFEPLIVLSNSSQCDLHRDMKIEMLKNFVRCALPDWRHVYENIPQNERAAWNRNIKACLIIGMCFRKNTKEICEDRHCPRTLQSSVKSCEQHCGAINRRLVTNECRRKSLVALKIIRVCDINDLEHIVTSSPVDVKIIHLLRDPRGIASSRMRLLPRFNIYNSMLETCKRQKQNMMTGLSNTPEWLKGRYMVVRYEDTALYPYSVAQLVYEFVGLNFPNTVKLWIKNNTDIPIPSEIEIESSQKIMTGQDRPSAQQHLEKFLQHRQRLNPYGTSRDSSKTVQKWVNRLSQSAVRTIENACTAFMNMAGYRKVDSVESYRINKTKYFSEEIPLLTGRMDKLTH